LFNHPDFPPNPPTRLFDEELTFHLGNHTFNCIHLPGHTAPQTAIHVPEEGVVFTGDNIFFKCKTFVQEADPWEWLDALNAIEALDVEAIIPGHGEVCDRSYLKQQGEIVQGWIGPVEDYVRRGLTEERPWLSLSSAKSTCTPSASGFPFERTPQRHERPQRLVPRVERQGQGDLRNRSRGFQPRREVRLRSGF
jgi:glyoxylase-like metal-dependent hydrolase (beta-lactamase superfamily II)